MVYLSEQIRMQTQASLAFAEFCCVNNVCNKQLPCSQEIVIAEYNLPMLVTGEAPGSGNPICSYWFQLQVWLISKGKENPISSHIFLFFKDNLSNVCSW